MATQTFNSIQELNAYLSQNPQIKGTINAGGQTVQYGGQPVQAQPKKERNFLESLVGSVVDPFVGLTKKTLEGVNAASLNKFGDFVSGNPNYQTAFLDQSEYDQFKANPLLDTLKDVAGVGSVFIPGGAGIKGLATAGLKSGALSSFANSDATDWRELDPTKIATDALIGGAIGGGLGIAGKAGGKLLEKFGGAKIGNKLVDAGESFRASNLNQKFKKDIPLDWQKANLDTAISRLKELGMDFTPENLDTAFQIGSEDLRNAVSQTKNRVNFGGQALDAENILKQSANEIRLPALDKNIRPSSIKNALKNNPDFAPFQEQIDALEAMIQETNPSSLGIDIGRIQSKTNRAGFADGAKGLDTLAQELDSKFPGMGFADTTDPADAILRFNEIRNRYKQELADTYETLHKGLLDADPNYAKSFGTSALEIPKTIQAGGGASTEIENSLIESLKKNTRIGDEQLKLNPSLTATIKDQAKEILATNGDPAELLKLKSKYTSNKLQNVDSYSQIDNQLADAVDTFLRDKITEAVPEVKGMLQQQDSIARLLPDARNSLNNRNKVYLPYTGGLGGVNVPGAGALKEGATNLAGKFLGGTGNLMNKASGLGRFSPESIGNQITPANLTKFGVLGLNGMQEGEMLQEDTMASQGMDTMGGMSTTPQQDPLQGYNPQEVAQLYQYLTNNKGGNMSDSEAQNYLKLSYGIDLNPQASKAGGAKPPSASERKIVAQADSGLRAVRGMRSLIAKDPLVIQKVLLPEYLQDENTRSFANYLAQGAENYGRVQSGGAISKPEEENFRKLISSFFASPKSQEQKLRELEQQFAEISGNTGN